MVQGFTILKFTIKVGIDDMTKTKEKIRWKVKDYGDVRRHLEKQMQNNKLSHAYLFFGPGERLGLAENFAKILLCEGKDKPCNKKACCRLFDLGHHQDFLSLKKEKRDTKIKIL